MAAVKMGRAVGALAPGAGDGRMGASYNTCFRSDEHTLEVQFGAAKAAKYAVQQSGDTLEVIERPHGGLSAVLVDGQRSGQSARIISNIVARKAISLLGEGVRDGAAARAAHDYLRTHRGGQVSAELQILSVDLETMSVVLSRNTRCPGLLYRDGQLEVVDAPSQPIGVYANTKPTITEWPLQAGSYVVIFTDGLQHAGQRSGMPFDFVANIEEVLLRGWSAQEIADVILDRALAADQYRPGDDVSVLVLAVLPMQVPRGVRRLSVSFPV